MVKPANTKAIENATGISWSEWCAFLDDSGAAQLEHNAIVKKAHTFHEITGWWAQEIAVAYEQYIGRRKPGQGNDGLYSASLSRTIAGSQQSTFAAWCDFASTLSEVNGQELAAAPANSKTPKWQYWRCKFTDGSSVSISFAAKADEKTLIAVEHKKLGRESDIAEKKRAWADLLRECFSP